MHIHILGVCGTFMGSLAQLAKASGHHVSGSDTNVYPPMSTQLEKAGIELIEGYDPKQFSPIPDLVVIGNALSRGNPAVEYVLDNRIPYTSGPQWLCDYFLKEKWVLAVAGTHGKTTTSSMLAWILEYAGMKPGFLIGGVPNNFDVSARLGDSPFFVVEADEYDSAFFDKRSKFVHYRPRTAILNNLEFDHADIFDDLAAIQKQFHHLIRTVPASGNVLLPDQPALREVINQGIWSNLEWLTGPQSSWQLELLTADQSHFSLHNKAHQQSIEIQWSLSGKHNIANVHAAIAAAQCVGVDIAQASEAMQTFRNVKRRQELIAHVNKVSVYDDFAHHPSAIKVTLAGLKAKFPGQRILAVIEPRSNTMRMGVHDSKLAEALGDANLIWWYQPASSGDSGAAIFENDSKVTIAQKTDTIVEQVVRNAVSGDVIVIMSNGGFEGIHQKIIDALGSATAVH